MAENPILTDKEQDKEISPPPPHPTTPVSERPSEPLLLMKSRTFMARTDIVPDIVYRNWFE